MRRSIKYIFFISRTILAIVEAVRLFLTKNKFYVYMYVYTLKFAKSIAIQEYECFSILGPSLVFLTSPLH